MSASKNIADLRVHLFAQLERLSDPTQALDLQRSRLLIETAQTIINSAQVEVDAAAVMKGAMTIPFIEEQAAERPNVPIGSDGGSGTDVPAPKPVRTLEDQILESGPALDHVWRRRSHRLEG